MNGQTDIDICKGLGILKRPPEGLYVPTNTNNKGEVEFTLKTTKEKISNFIVDFNEMIYSEKRHKELCCILINNLFKKTSFLQLTIRLLENQISEEEYENEITSHPEKYVIDINKYFDDSRDLKILFDIVKNIKHSLTLDEAAEIFSLDPHDVEKNIATQ